MSKFRVLIVGAGASGIAAASRLAECGFKDFIILEAEGRIGGRIHTSEFGERVVDFGAQWVHGEKNNISYELAKPYQLLEESSSSYPDTQFVTSSGEIINSGVTDKVMMLIAQINEAAITDLVGYHGSLGEYFTKEFENKLQDDSHQDLDKKLARSFLEWYHKFENGIDAADSWFETSGKGHIDYWECEGNPLLNWKNGGYASIIDLLVKRFPDPQNELPVLSKVQCNKEVISIQWDGFSCPEKENKVSVTCSDGSQYIAEHVIMTVSLGVLKENIGMFHPELPKKNVNAIKGLAIGTVDKIYLRYSHRWWPQDCAGFSLVWNDDDLEGFRDQLTKNGVEGKNWLGDIFGFYSVDNHPLVLCGWLVGPSARAMEQVSDEQIAESCSFLLNHFLGHHFSIPPCEEVKKSTWFANQHFRGSYSYRSMETEAMGTSAEHLSSPLTNENGSVVVQFAGEATHPHYFSTVHGAIEAGWREADHLLKTIRYHSDSCGRSGTEELTKCDVIIVGAGMAGLAAAKTLLNDGMNDIVILEAQDYAGGRVKSMSLGQSFIEVGAQWIHGEDNDVYRIAHKYGLTSNVRSMEGEGLYLREDGSTVRSELAEEVGKVVDEILEECEIFANNQNTIYGIPSSVGHHLKQKFSNYLNLCHQSSESEELIEIKEELYNWHLRFQIIDNSCLKLENLSAKSWGNYADCDGSHHVNFCSGYSSFVEKLQSELPPGVLHLNCPVREVKWQPIIQGGSGDKSMRLDSLGVCSKQSKEEVKSLQSFQVANLPVNIVCKDGRQFVAYHAIITCSLGYLKENYKEMFNPQLPVQIQGAIEDMGFATINKIFLDFGEPWWEPHIKGFQILWSKKKEALSSGWKQENWMHDLTGFDVLNNHAGVLLGWVGSYGAEKVEEIPEDIIGEQCVKLLRKFTQREDIPFPKTVIRSKWFSNPYVRGAYSHTTSLCDSSGSSPTLLSEPVYSKLSQEDADNNLKHQHPTVLFAGEAIHECHFSTTHGAFESGKHQAMVILQARRNATR